MGDKAKRIEENKEIMEKTVDKMLEDEIINRIAWVLRLAPLSDLRDVAIGYVVATAFQRLERIGLISEIINGSELVSEDYQNLLAILREKLPKICEKVEKEFCE